MRTPARNALLSILSIVLVLPDAQAQELPTVPASAYGRWESLAGVTLSQDGAWVAVGIRRVNEKNELRVHAADGGVLWVVERGERPSFSPDGGWLTYLVAPEEAEDRGGPGREDPPQTRAFLRELATGVELDLGPARSLAWRGDGQVLAVLRPGTARDAGSDLTLIWPGEDRRTSFGNVRDLEWQDEGGLLAFTLETASGEGNGVVLFDPDRRVLRTLDSRSGKGYPGLAWREESGDLAVLRSRSDEGFEEDGHDVLVWKDADPESDGAPDFELLGVFAEEEAEGREDIPEGQGIVAESGIRWSRDGGRIFVGINPREGAGAEADDPRGGAEAEGAEGPGPESEGTEADQEEVGPSDVEIWHSRDEDIIPRQQVYEDRDRNRSHLSVWHLEEDRFVRLGRDLAVPLDLVPGERFALEADHSAYLFDWMFGRRFEEVFLVDVEDGSRTPVAEAVTFGVSPSPEGGYLTWFTDGAWNVYEIDSGETRIVSGPFEGAFERSWEAYDYPGPRPSWGSAGWTENDQALLIYDEFDVWQVDPGTGGAERVTAGAEEEIVHRVVRPDRTGGFGFARNDAIDPSDPIYLSIEGKWTKDQGYARLDPDGSVSRLLLTDDGVSGLAKAEDADRFALVIQDWDDSPDVFVTGPDLGELEQVTNTNPFQAEFAWGRSDLLDYTTASGLRLQAALIYPSDFEPGRRYPMILYQYEILSSLVHRYAVPSERDYYNRQAWSQNGYFVLLPDIVYQNGRPGPSALEAVTAAVDAAVETGHVDPNAVGLIGHSWGGYQAAYLPTRTDLFAASVSGAAITNFLSFMGAIHWNIGMPETDHWETGQARMAAPFWEAFDEHLESSPAHGIQDLDTPILMAFGDEDGTVDFTQGVEFYNYARRAGKQLVLLVYPGENHGFRKKENQVDYHRRILQWFGHYLKGEDPADWILRGEPWLDQLERIGSGG